uniref:Putative reverse transcriptase-RNaseH-integrase n=1 Tax=Moniliophthora roreri TaxID=221103 RepID=A0A0W0F957_MONRR
MDIEKLHSDIRTALPSDPEAVVGMQHAQKGHNRWTINNSGLLRLDDRIFVPSADDLCLQVCKHHHDHVLAGHFGQNCTPAIIQHSYTWPRIWDFVKDYVRSCTDCCRNKSHRHQPYRMLKPLPVPTRPWDSISLNFIEQLPNSNGHTSILVIIDRASKQAIFIPLPKKITSETLARLFVIHVFSKHGVPNHVTSDRGSKFISSFSQGLRQALKMTLHFTSGYHPEADGQTEQANQTLEQYLRMYCTYQQDNWDTLLPLAKFAYNNAPNASTGVSPFFANKRYHLNITVHLEYHLASQKARNYVSNLDDVHQFLCNEIKAAQEAYKTTANSRRKPAPDFQVGQQVYILAKHLKTTRPMKKLSEKYLGLYTIIAQPSSNAFTVRLPDYFSSIHPVFHVSQLKPFHPSEIPNRTEPPPPPVKIDDEDEPHSLCTRCSFNMVFSLRKHLIFLQREFL